MINFLLCVLFWIMSFPFWLQRNGHWCKSNTSRIQFFRFFDFSDALFGCINKSWRWLSNVMDRKNHRAATFSDNFPWKRQNINFQLQYYLIICLCSKFCNLDFNFNALLLQHMFKKAKELSDEKVFWSDSSFITIYNGTALTFFEMKIARKKNDDRCRWTLRSPHTRWSTNTSGSWTRTSPSLNPRWRWFQIFSSDAVIIPLFRIKDGCHRRRARKRRWSTRRRWRTRRRRESKRTTTGRRRRQRRWGGQLALLERVNQCLPQVENLTTPLISYVGSGVPQEVLDMPVDPNEPTYCTCQQVTLKNGIVVQNFPKTQKLGSQFVLH